MIHMICKNEGIVLSVLSSDLHGYPTYERDIVNVGPMGIEGDAHSGPMRESFTRPGTFKLNDRPISLVAWEVMRDANKTLGLDLKPGDFNEQLLVSGLGDLGWVALGSVITFADSCVKLEVVDYAYPCIKISQYNEPKKKTEDYQLLEFLIDNSRHNETGKPYSKRGILAKVTNPGILHPEMVVMVR